MTSNQGISIAIREKIKKKRKLLKEHQRTKNPNVKRELNKISREIRNDIRTSDSQKLQKQIDNIQKNDSKTSWKSFNHLFKKKKSAKISKIMNPQTRETTVKEQEIADVFKKCQEEIFKGNETEDFAHEARVNRWYESLRPTQNAQVFIEEAEIRKKITNLKNNKAPGVDNISNIIIKYLEPSLSKILYKIFNSCYNIGYFPLSWKVAKIVMIHKKDSKLDPDNYRPISLLNQFGKIFESLITDIVRFWAEDSDIIDIHQAGFRKGRSTNDQLYLLAQESFEAFNRKRQVDAVFIDFSKAFDKVWHRGLLYKLKALGLPNEELFLIKSFLENRECFVQVGDSKSESFSPESGVPQGSCLSPLLFILFVSDLPKDPKVNLSKFADDLAVYKSIGGKIVRRHATPDKDLQNQLYLIEKWCLKWKLKINLEKTKKMSITRGIAIDTNYKIMGSWIETTTELKFLGIILDRRLTLSTHVTKVIGKACQKIQILVKMLSLHINVKTKRKVYLTLIRPVLEYGSSILCMTYDFNFSKLNVFQNKCLRMIGNFRRRKRITEMWHELNIPCFKERVKSLGKNWLLKAKTNPKNSVSHKREVYFNGFDTYLTPHEILSA